MGDLAHSKQRVCLMLLLSFSEPQLPRLWNGDVNGIDCGN